MRDYVSLTKLFQYHQNQLHLPVAQSHAKPHPACLPNYLQRRDLQLICLSSHFHLRKQAFAVIISLPSFLARLMSMEQTVCCPSFRLLASTSRKFTYIKVVKTFSVFPKQNKNTMRFWKDLSGTIAVADQV